MPSSSSPFRALPDMDGFEGLFEAQNAAQWHVYPEDPTQAIQITHSFPTPTMMEKTPMAPRGMVKDWSVFTSPSIPQPFLATPGPGRTAYTPTSLACPPILEEDGGDMTDPLPVHMPSSATVTPVGSPFPAGKKRHEGMMMGLGRAPVSSPAARFRTSSAAIMSPVNIRRSTAPSSSLTTTAPLARSASASEVPTSPFNARLVSSSSVASYVLRSPQTAPMESHALMPPALMPSSSSAIDGSLSAEPSPNVSNHPMTPLATVFASPLEQQEGFSLDFGTLAQGGAQLLTSTPSTTQLGSTSRIPSAAYFPHQPYTQLPHDLRQATTDTMVSYASTQSTIGMGELVTPSQPFVSTMPAMPHSAPAEASFAPSGQLLRNAPRFERVQYPPVPGMYSAPMQAQVAGANMQIGMGVPMPGADAYGNVSQWVGNQQQWQQHQAQQAAPPLMRHASASVTMPATLPGADARVFHRSLSASHVSQMPMMPAGMTHGGLFPMVGDLASINMAQAGFAPSQFGPSKRSVSATPETPRKKAYPPVGNRLRPGPRPKSKTPQSKHRSASSPPDPRTLNPATLLHRAPSVPGDEIPPLSLPMHPTSSAMGSEIFGPALSIKEVEDDGPLPPINYRDAHTGEMQVLLPHMNKGQGKGLPKELLQQLFTTFQALDEHGAGPSKRYRCLIEDCDRDFPRKSAVEAHIQTHLDDKPNKCPIPDW